MKSFVITDSRKGAPYDADSVNQSISAHNRRSRSKIGKVEAQLIHAVLQGRSIAPYQGNGT
jgi:hypothetical protein